MQHLEPWPAKCDCGCGRAPAIIFNRHYFHEWACTGGYERKEYPDEAEVQVRSG